MPGPLTAGSIHILVTGGGEGALLIVAIDIALEETVVDRGSQRADDTFILQQDGLGVDVILQALGMLC